MFSHDQRGVMNYEIAAQLMDPQGTWGHVVVP